MHTRIYCPRASTTRSFGASGILAHDADRQQRREAARRLVRDDEVAHARGEARRLEEVEKVAHVAPALELDGRRAG